MLRYDRVCEVAKLRASDKIQCHLRLAPHSIKRIIPLEKGCDGVVRGVAGVDPITRLDRYAKGRPAEIDHARDRLGPPGSDCAEYVDLRLVRNKVVLLDKITSDLGETITLIVAMKQPPEEKPEATAGVRGTAAHAVLHTDIHHAARKQANQMEIGKVGDRG